MIKQNLKIYLLIGGLILLIAIIILARIFTLEDQTTPIPTPTPTPTITTNPEVYTPNSLDKDLERIASKKALAASDARIRTTLIARANKTTGLIEENSNFKVEYVAAPNSFMVEIINSNATTAKGAAEKWFLDQGLSQEGVCNLPVVFYLNYQVKIFLEEQKTEFNPIPTGCI